VHFGQAIHYFAVELEGCAKLADFLCQIAHCRVVRVGSISQRLSRRPAKRMGFRGGDHKRDFQYSYSIWYYLRNDLRIIRNFHRVVLHLYRVCGIPPYGGNPERGIDFASSLARAEQKASVAYHMVPFFPTHSSLLVASRSLITANNTWIATANMRKEADSTASTTKTPPRNGAKSITRFPPRPLSWPGTRKPLPVKHRRRTVALV